MNEIKVLENIIKTSGKNAKVDILVQNETTELLELLDLAYNPYKIFGLKHIEYVKAKDYLYKKEQHAIFVNLCIYCLEHNTNTEKRKIVGDFLSKQTQPQQRIYHDILIKKLRLGVTDNTLNKIWDNFVPSFKVMLADSDDTMNYYAKKIVQEKLDGVRCTIFKENGTCSAFTRNGKSLYLENIFRDLESLKNYDNFMLDQELFYNSRTETTSITTKIIRESDGATDELLTSFVFDFMPLADFKDKNCKIEQHERIANLEIFTNNLSSSRIVMADTWVTNSKEEILNIYRNIVNIKKGEGVIVKDYYGLYQHKRSKLWTKLKRAHVCTLEVIGYEEGTGKDSNSLGAILCKTSCGSITTNVGSGFSHELRVNMWNARKTIVGNMVEIKYNELQYTEKGAPYLFLPVFIETRIDKVEADSLEKIKKEFEGDVK